MTDWRLGQIEKLPNVELYRESRMAPEDIAELEIAHVLVATGARWATDGIGRHHTQAIEAEGAVLVSVDRVVDWLLDLPGAALPRGRSVLIYDDDHYYMASVLALALRARGYDVTLATPLGRPATWCDKTEEQERTIAELIAAGVTIRTNEQLARAAQGAATLACVFSGNRREVAADWVVPLTRRVPEDALYHQLVGTGLTTLRRTGDCEAPSLIAGAVYGGYRAGIELGEEIDEGVAYARREQPPA
ncbi:hypothetical protein KHP62_05250 [Rhodobacteraceae bacterium NNCM2]|nr:hypothetical protein [Coraliihabitans acroporae]